MYVSVLIKTLPLYHDILDLVKIMVTVSLWNTTQDLPIIVQNCQSLPRPVNHCPDLPIIVQTCHSLSRPVNHCRMINSVPDVRTPDCYHGYPDCQYQPEPDHDQSQSAITGSGPNNNHAEPTVTGSGPSNRTGQIPT